MSSGIKEALVQSRALRCLSCGKCTAVCPISARSSNFSPRMLVEWVATQTSIVESHVDSAIWSCLTCGRCSERCNSGVDFPSFIRRLRAPSDRSAQKYLCSRGAAAQSLARIASGRPQGQGQLKWLDPDLRVASKSSVLLFVGCLPYFDALAKDTGARPLDIARSAIRLLNAVGIQPSLLPSEACCGHDFLWTGDLTGFLSLAQHNVSQILDSKAETIVTPCPECFQSLKVDYPNHFGSLGVEIVHLSAFLAERLAGLPVRNSPKKNRVVTYHDPCRLGRFAGLYDQPRQMLAALPGLELREMSKSGAMAECCGAHAWNNCGAVAKEIQLDRLNEARSVDASALVTACPKCEIHFRCAMKSAGTTEFPGPEVVDLFTLVADALAPRPGDP